MKHSYTIIASHFFLIAIGLFCNTFSLHAQSDLRIGEWAAHLPFNIGKTVTQSPSRVYYGTEFGLMAISKEDSSQVEFFSKVDGLSDVGASWIKYHEGLNMIIIGYQNGNIDLLETDGISNVNDILQNTSIQGDKSINHIFIDEGNLAYLSTPFGLVILDVVNQRFTSTVFSTSPAFGFTIFQNKYYLSTANGIYVFDPASGNIIEDFGKWQKFTTGIPATYSSQAIAVHQGILYAGVNGDLYKMVQDTFRFLYEKTGYTVQYISPEGNALMVGFKCDIDCLGSVIFFQNGQYWHDNGLHCAPKPLYAIEDEKGRVWYADEYPQIKLAQNTFTPCDLLSYNTPYSGSVSELEVKDGVLYVATGGVS